MVSNRNVPKCVPMTECSSCLHGNMRDIVATCKLTYPTVEIWSGCVARQSALAAKHPAAAAD